MGITRNMFILAAGLIIGGWLGARYDTAVRTWIYGSDLAAQYQHRVDVLERFGSCREFVFYGDSQVEYGPWDHAFGGRVGNFGVSSDKAAGVLARMDTECSSHLVLLIGVNDVRARVPDDDFVSTIQAIFAATRGDIFLIEIMPVAGDHARWNPDLARVNRRLEEICEGRCTWVPTWDVLAKDGVLRSEFTRDGLHLTSAGYALLVERVAMALNLPLLPSRAGTD
ncbi:MAG: GDSL-type esterase/lipase family protein [Pseudomonadota bacterium]